MKKVLICIMCAIILIPVFIAGFVFSYIALEGKLTFNKQKKAAINFVEQNYQEKFELIDARNVNFNAGFSEFYFYNSEDDFYFSVSVDSGPMQGEYEVYGSDYEEQKRGSLISKDIREKFTNFYFMISSYKYTSEINDNNAEVQESKGCTFIKMLEKDGISDVEIYKFLKYIIEEHKINVDFFLLDTKEYQSFKRNPLNDLSANAGFEYEKHIEIYFGDERFEIKKTSDFDYEMYLNLQKWDEYINDFSGTTVDPFK